MESSMEVKFAVDGKLFIVKPIFKETTVSGEPAPANYPGSSNVESVTLTINDGTNTASIILPRKEAMRAATSISQNY